MKKQLNTKRIRVSCLFPKQEQFEKFGFKFVKFGNVYERIELPMDWKIRKVFRDEYLILDNKNRARGIIVYLKNDIKNSYILLYPVFSIGVLANGDDSSCSILISDEFHKIVEDSYIQIAKFEFDKSEFDCLRAYFFSLYDLFISRNFFGDYSIDLAGFETNLLKEKILESFQDADDFLEERFPNWKDPCLYWD